MASNHKAWMSVTVGMLLGLVAAGAASKRLPASASDEQRKVAAPLARNAAPSGTERYLRLANNQLLTLSSNGKELRLQEVNRSNRTRIWALPEVRRDASLTLLPDGRVLVWGGQDALGNLQPNGLWFDPELRAVEPALRLPMTPRASHTATVLTDGRVLFASGVGRQHDYELWNPDSGQWKALDDATPAAVGHRAILQADGQVRLLGAVAGSGERADLWFDPERDEVAPRASNEARPIAEGLAGSVPAQGATNVAIDARLALRFSEPVRQDDFSETNVTLFGPGGATGARVVVVEGGRLAFVTPRHELFPDAPYTLMVDGVATRTGKRLPLMTLDFRTAALTSPQVPEAGDPSGQGEAGAIVSYCDGKSRTLALCQRQGQMQDGIWTPGRDNAGENWRVPGRQPEAMPLGFMPEIFKAWGKTALIGSILRADGQPVAGVAVSVGNRLVRTNGEGRFLLYDVPAGRQKVYVDGTTANAPGVEYGQFIVGVDVQSGGLTQVPFTMWLPRISARDKIQIPSPTTRDLVLKHPDLPGMELHIPAGTVIRDQKGKIVTEVAIVPTPVNRSPYPLPTNFPMYFTLQPGGAVLQGLTPQAGRGARVHYPNYDRHPAGTAADFWLYDAMEGWRVYGQGRVNETESQFVPEDGVALREVVTFGAAVSPNDPAPEEGMPPDPQECGECNAGTGSNATAGDPIDLKTGRFSYQETDIAINDVVPVELGRSYRPSDRVKREFGYGTSAGFAYRISMKNSNYSELQLVMPNGTPLVFKQISGSGAYGSWRYDGKQSISGAILASESINGYKYRLTMRNGAQMVFEAHSPNRILWSQDRYGNKTEYIYDAGRVSRIMSPNGRYLDLEYDTQNRIVAASDLLGTTWRYEYNAQGLLAKVIYPDSTFRRYEYQSWGSGTTLQHRLSALYDQRGNRVLLNEYEETLRGTTPATTGRVIRQTLADGAVYQIQYDHVDGSTLGTLVTHPDGSKRRVVFGDGIYPISDALAYGTPLEQEYRFERDTEGRMTARIDPLGRRTEYQYDTFGQLTRIVLLAGTPKALTSRIAYTAEGQVASLTDPLERTTRLEYNQGCLSRATNTLGNSSFFTCNSAGQRETATDPLSNTGIAYYIGGEIAAISDPLGRNVAFRYDALGRPIASQGADGQVARTEYDALGRMVKTVGPDGGITEMAYDANNNVTDVLLPHQAGITYEYDSRDRVIKRTDSLGQSESWTYDPMGRVLTYTDRRQFTTQYTYDRLGRRETTTYHDGSAVTSSYDIGNRRLSLVDSVSGALSWQYDDFDRIVEVASPQGVISYGYDAVGRRTSMVADTQPMVEYRYDLADRLIRILQGSEVVDFAYDASDRLTGTTLPNQIKTAYVYNTASELTGIAWGHDGQEALGSLGYGYDNMGRLTAQTGTYAPDSRPLASTGTNAFDDNNRQTQYNGQSLSYDASGNLIGDGARSYEWNSRNQLVQIKQGAAIIAKYNYDALGRRISKIENGQVVTYLYDRLNAVQETRDAVINPILTGPGIDQRFARNEGSTRTYFLVDHLGSTRALVDTVGNVINRYDYDPYGAPTQTAAGFTNPYQYTGRERDGTGLYYYRARYYHPGMGRFISDDPIGLSGGINGYAYVGGNPLSFIDPKGLSSTSACANPANAAACAEAGIGAAPKPLPPPGLKGPAAAIWCWFLDCVQGPGQQNSEAGENPKECPTAPDTEDFEDPDNLPEGWEWRGKGRPGSRQGAYHNPTTGESMHDDRTHPAGKAPHWTYTDPSGDRWDNYGSGWVPQK